MRVAIGSVLLLSSIGTFVVVGAWGQAKPKPDTATYAAEPLVVVQSNVRYRMQADGTGFLERTVVAKLQGESTLKQVSVLSVPFAGNYQHVEWVYARVRHADGTVKETPAENAIEVADPVTREAPFYSDLKESQLPLRDLRLGDQLEWKARVVTTKAEAPNEFWGQDSFTQDAVVLSETLELDVPKDTFVNVWSPKHKPVESIDGGDKVYRWESSYLKPTVGPEADAAKEIEKKRVRTPEEQIDNREGKLPDVAWTTFKSWADVGAWYRSLSAERAMPDADVTAKVAQLTAGKTSETEKAEAVYAYVSSQVRYIGVAFGIGRYQPHAAGDVLANQYGDCKDKHTLLAAMLTVLGLHPEAVLIGQGIRLNEAVPSPAAFNHLITRVDLGGKPVWLDSTAEVAPFGMLIFPTRDKNALVIPPASEAKLEKTPAMPPFPSSESFDSVGTLDAEGTSHSKLTVTSRGDDELILRAVFRQISPAQYDLFVQKMSAAIGYGGTTSHAQPEHIDDTSVPFRLVYDYERSKAGDWANLKTIPQLSPVQLPRPDEKEPPVFDIELGVPQVASSKSQMKLPEGWSATLPEAVHQKSEWVTYDQTYKLEKGTLYSERKIEVLKPRVPVAQWKEYYKFTEAADLGNDQYVQLIAKETLAAKASGGVASVNVDPEEMKRMQVQSMLSMTQYFIREHDFAKAQASLDSAKEMDPKYDKLWDMYGALDLARDKPTEAITDFRKELALHPGEYGAYEGVADAQWKAGLRADAEATFVSWIAADPSSSQAPLRLAGRYIEDKQSAKAVTIAKDALARNPNGELAITRLKIVLGRAQLKSGETDPGKATLLDVLKTSEDASLLNDAAYELADAGLALSDADAGSRTAIKKLETESKEWTLQQDQGRLRARTSLILAAWDTMGWALFREGHLVEAQGYVSAAWNANPRIVVGEHLAEIQAALGDKDAALTTCELALATATDADSDARAIAEAEAGKLRKAGAHSQVPDAKAMLAAMKLVPLGKHDDMGGTANYRLLWGDEKVIKAAGNGANWVNGGEELVLTAVFPKLFPPHSEMRLVTQGTLTCKAHMCALVVEP